METSNGDMSAENDLHHSCGCSDVVLAHYSHVRLINFALNMSREIGPLEERAESQEAPITGAPT